MRKKIGLFGLVGVVVGSCIGTGVFALTYQVASVASPGGALVALAVVGAGFACLALSFASLGTKRSDLTSVFSYAQEGFGPLAGFVSGWGYWLSAWVGNIAYAIMLCSTIGYFYEPFLSGQTIPCIIFASVVMWLLVYLVIRGVESAAFLNAVVMVVKVIGLVVFIGFALASFKMGVFTKDFWGNLYNNAVAMGSLGADAKPLGGLDRQVVRCVIVMIWAFIGIEGATVLSSRARNKKDVGRATIIGLIVLLVLYVFMVVAPYGVMPYTEVAKLSTGATLHVFEQIAPGWGGAFISCVVIVTIIGAWLSFIILPVEVASDMASAKLLPASWGKLNKYHSPQISVLIVGFCMQAFMISLLFSKNAYDFAVAMCAVPIAFTWALAAAYHAKFSMQRKELLQALIGAVAAIFLIVGAFLDQPYSVLLSSVGYIPGLAVYIYVRRSHGCAITLAEKVFMALIGVAAVISLVLVMQGTITI